MQTLFLATSAAGFALRDDECTENFANANCTMPPEEVEVKLLQVGDNPDIFDRLIEDVKRQDVVSVASQTRNPCLIQSVRDTADYLLFNHELSLRVRGTAFEVASQTLLLPDNHPDMCLKGKGYVCATSGATICPEFEALTPDFCAVDLDAFAKKFPLHLPQHAFLSDALELIGDSPLEEVVRLHIDRQRLVVVVDNHILDLKEDQKFAAEFNIDRVITYKPVNNGKDLMRLGTPYIEIEIEALDRPCSWSGDIDASENICRNLSADDRAVGIKFMCDYIMGIAPKNSLALSDCNKSQRAYERFFECVPGAMTSAPEPEPAVIL